MTSPASPHNRRSDGTQKPSNAPTSAWEAAHAETRKPQSQSKRPQQHMPDSAAASDAASGSAASSEATSGSAREVARGGEQEGIDKGQLAIIILVVLGVIASVVMLLVGSVAAMKISLLVLLWAAVLGLFLVVRYRRQAQDTQHALDERESQHRAELDRLSAASRDRGCDFDIESARAGQPRPGAGMDASGLTKEDVEMLREIRTEIASIRAQLEELSGREFTYEPAALRAEARRIMEVEARAHVASASQAPSASGASADPASEENFNFTQSSSGAPSADAIAGRLGSEPVGGYPNEQLRDIVAEQKSTGTATASKVAAPAAEAPAETSADSSADSRGSHSKDIHAESSHAEGSQAEGTQAEGTHSDAAHTEQIPSDDAGDRTFDTGSFQAVRWDKGGDENVRRGRRRQDEGRTGSVSVAELLAANKKDRKH